MRKLSPEVERAIAQEALQNPNIRLSDLAGQFGISESTLLRILKQHEVRRPRGIASPAFRLHREDANA